MSDHDREDDNDKPVTRRELRLELSNLAATIHLRVVILVVGVGAGGQVLERIDRSAAAASAIAATAGVGAVIAAAIGR